MIKDDERLDIVDAGLQKEVVDHEIFVVDSRADRDISPRGAFHGRDADRVTTVPDAE